ncbi:MAG: CBS domain-containing protein [Dokdonella sp.]
MIDLARERLVVLADSAPLIDAARLFDKLDTDIVVICAADGRLAGVVTKTDVVQQIGRCQGSACTTLVSSVMTQDVLACRHGEELSLVWSEMKARKLKNVPVLDDQSKPVGVLNARDALQALLVEVENEESLLRDYVMTVGYH